MSSSPRKKAPGIWALLDYVHINMDSRVSVRTVHMFFPTPLRRRRQILRRDRRSVRRGIPQVVYTGFPQLHYKLLLHLHPLFSLRKHLCSKLVCMRVEYYKKQRDPIASSLLLRYRFQNEYVLYTISLLFHRRHK